MLFPREHYHIGCAYVVILRPNGTTYTSISHYDVKGARDHVRSMRKHRQFARRNKPNSIVRLKAWR